MLSEECLLACKTKMEIEDWNEIYRDELFDERSEQFGLTEEEYDAIGCGDDVDRYEEFIDWTVDVYMND